MLGRDSYLVPTLSRIPILRFMSPGATLERIPTNVGARRDSRTSRRDLRTSRQHYNRYTKSENALEPALPLRTQEVAHETPALLR